MTRREGGLFAGGGIQLPSAKVTILTVLALFALGIAVGWFTSALPGMIEARTSPSPSPSPTVVLSPEASPEVTVPPLAPITRELDDDDLLAGIMSLDYEFEAEGTFTLVPGATEPDPLGPPVRWVSFEIEDGLEVSHRSFTGFVMDVLNHPRAWGANGRRQYARTDGVADIRIVLASPYTAAALCPNPHAAAPDRTDLGGDLEATPTPSPDPDPSPLPTIDPTDDTCAERSIMAISFYDWAAGLDVFEDERTRSRVYQLMHGVGHLMGNEDLECDEGRADVMVDQTDMPEECSTNPWPFPDAEIPEQEPAQEPDPDPSP